MSVRHYSTRDVCRALGIARATLYNWQVEPDHQGPGDRGTLGWTERTIRRLGKAHGRTIDETVFTDG